MPITFVPADLFDRQADTAKGGAVALAQVVDGQRDILAAALQLSYLSLEAVVHLTRAMISSGVELTDRAASTSAESVEQLSQTLALADDDETATPNRNGRRRTTRAV